MKKIKFISLFAGIGGLDLGLERAEMECVAQVEIDDFCQKVLTKHWPNVPKFKDVRDVGKHNLPSADLICGGFPCQPHSYAGKRKGKKDDRNLWPEYFRIVREVKPRYVIGENVPGLITTMLDEILSDLESIGYTCQTFVIPALAFDANHRRNRVFVIANSESSTRDVSISTRIKEKELHIGRNGTAQSMADTERIRREGERESRNVARSLGLRSREGGNEKQSISERLGEIWAVEPAICRVAHGIPARVDRLRSLGNAVVPQVAEFVGRCIVEMSNTNP